MSISLRTHRAAVFAYADVGSDGAVDSVYVPVLSSSQDGRWWCSEGYEGMGESTVGRTAQHAMQGVFVFAAEAPMANQATGVHYAMIVDGGTYHVRSVRPARYGRNEIIIAAERVIGFDLGVTPATTASVAGVVRGAGARLRAQLGTLIGAFGTVRATSVRLLGQVSALTTPALDLFATSLGLTEGATVTTWPDDSPGGLDASSGGSGADAVYHTDTLGPADRPGVHLQASTRFLSIAPNPCPGTAMTWMVVYRTPGGAGIGANWSANAALIWADVAGVGGNDYALSLSAAGFFTGGVGCSGADGTAVTGTNFGDDATHLVTFRRNGGDWIIRVDGVEEGTHSNPAFACATDGPTFLLFGGNGFAEATTWQLGRITAWPVALSDTEMLAQEAERMTYYGL